MKTCDRFERRPVGGSQRTTLKGGDVLEILVGPFFAVIDAALDRPLMPVAATSIVGGAVAILLAVS